MFSLAFVINRVVDRDRFRQFQRSAKCAGLNVTRIRALDKSRMHIGKLRANGEITERVARIIRQGNLQGTFACTISHTRLWRELAQHDVDEDAFLIFEDDSAIPSNFLPRLEKAMKSAPTDWDMLYLNHNRLVGHKIGRGVWFAPQKKYSGVGTNALHNAYLVRPPGLR